MQTPIPETAKDALAKETELSDIEVSSRTIAQGAVIGEVVSNDLVSQSFFFV